METIDLSIRKKKQNCIVFEIEILGIYNKKKKINWTNHKRKKKRDREEKFRSKKYKIK